MPGCVALFCAGSCCAVLCPAVLCCATRKLPSGCGSTDIVRGCHVLYCQLPAATVATVALLVIYFVTAFIHRYFQMLTGKAELEARV